MHLESMSLTNFRSFEEATVKFQPDLTVLVGENNGGKSNIIDAIRLMTPPMSRRRDRYPEDEDIRTGSGANEFIISTCYAGLSDTLKGLLIRALVDPTDNRAVFRMRYQASDAGSPRGKVLFGAGKFSEPPEPGSLELIKHVYLPPLRDARQSLSSGRSARLVSLIRNFLISKEAEADFVESFRRNIRNEIIDQLNIEIQSSLRRLTVGVREQAAAVTVASQTLFDVARDFRIRMADAGMSLQDIELSGLGYANLLYIATVIVELTRAKETDLTLFLVEEPEAHLHPQLQQIVLDFLLETAQSTLKRENQPGLPEGRIQVIATTHSPNLTAWVSPHHVVAVRSEMGDKDRTVPKTTTIGIAELGLNSSAMRKISRYLDVTKSALLFGTRVLLVEGIAEAILLPVIAKHHVLQDNPDGLQRFRGTVVVAIDGVDFRPYVELLLRVQNGNRIADKVVIITDADPHLNQNRKADLEKLANSLGSGSHLEVFTNTHTLEYDLFLAGNECLLKQCFLALHPESQSDWDKRISAAPANDKPMAFMDLLRSKRTRKGDLAQQIATEIESGKPFTVPEYFRQAILSIAQS